MVSGKRSGFTTVIFERHFKVQTIWPALRFQRDQINSLRNGQDCDPKQTGNAFKDPEDGLWEKNSSEGIVGNSEVY